jgi:hypothetical protein
MQDMPQGAYETASALAQERSLPQLPSLKLSALDPSTGKSRGLVV